MPNINLSILNQKATPAFFADTLANRPAPSFVGRIFISTDTLDLYRDTGTAWLLLSPSSTGTITGSGAAGQVTYFSAASSITGNNNLFYDTALSHLGINTNTPGSALDVHDDQSTLVQLNQTIATNDTRIGFQNSGTALWRIGNFYNAGANDWGIFDVVGAAQPFTIKKTTGQTFIGAETSSSGRLVVNNTTGDNHIVVIGATAPSIRINNAGTGATRRIGIGLATAVNNFIQGTTGGEMAIFNSSTTASPILFGVYDSGLSNTQEAARISAARNFIVGSSVDAGFKFDVNGAARVTGVIYADNSIRVANGIIGTNSNNLLLSSNTTGGEISFWNNQLGNRLMTLTGAGNLEIGATGFVSPSGADKYIGLYGAQDCSLILQDAVQLWELYVNDDFYINRGSTNVFTALRTNGNVGIGTTSPQSRLQVTTSSFPILKVADTIGGGGVALGDAAIPDNYMGIWRGQANSISGGQFLNIQGDGIAFMSSNSVFGSGTERMRIPSATGNLLIGTTTDIGAKLHVNGNIISSGNSGSNAFLSRETSSITTYGFFNSGIGSLVLTNSGVANVGSFNMATGVYTATSDKNKKKNFEQSNIGLSSILKLKPTLYNMISQSDYEAKELGFIAQEVKEVIGQAYIENGEFIGLNYQPIVAALVKAIQDLNNKIENLKN